MPFFDLSPELVTFGLATIPIVEVRGAIPFGILSGLSPISAIAFAFLGSAVTVLMVAPILYRIGNTLAQRPLFNALFSRVFSFTRRRHEKRFARAKELALFSLVVIPLPFSGVWSGMLAAYVFGIPLRRTIPLCILGSLVGSFAVGILAVGIMQLFA